MASGGSSPIQLPDGTRVVITRPASDPQRDPFELELRVPPGGLAAPPHVHPDQTDEFDVVSGRLEVLHDGTWKAVGPGETLVVAPGEVHTYRNRSGDWAVVRNVHDPAGSFQEYVERIGLLAAEGKLRRPRAPRGLLYLSLLWSEHEDSMRFASPPVRAVVAALARVARLLRMHVPRTSR